MRLSYTKQHLSFLKKNFPKMNVEKLTEAFNKKFNLNQEVKKIKSTLDNHQIRSGRGRGAIKGEMKLLTPPQVEFLKKEYKTHTSEKVTALINEKFNLSLSANQIRFFIRNHKIQSGRSGHFKAGQTPWNAGTKGVMKPNSGNFKKGATPHNHRPVGSTRLTKDGYTTIKIAEPNEWELLARHNWALKYGSENMPDNLRFKDGDKSNCEPENLEPVSNQEHMMLNQMGFNEMPDEVKPVILMIARIDVKTKNLTESKVA